MSSTTCPHCHHDLASFQDYVLETCPECGEPLHGALEPKTPPTRRVRRHFLRLDASSLVCKNCGTIDAQTIHRNYVASLRHILPHWVSALGIAGGSGKLCKVCHQLDLVPAGSEEGQRTLQRHHPDAQVIGSLGRRRRVLGWILGVGILFGGVGALTWTVVFPKLSAWLNGGDDTTLITRKQVIADCQTFVRQSDKFPPGADFDADRELHADSIDAQWTVDGEITRINPGAARTRMFYTCVLRYVNQHPELDQLEIR